MQHGFIQEFLAHLLSLRICGTNNKTRILVNTFSHLRVNKKHFVYISCSRSRHSHELCVRLLWVSSHTDYTPARWHMCDVISDCVYAFCRSNMLEQGHVRIFYVNGPLSNKYCVSHVMSVFIFVMQKDHQTYILSICVLNVFHCTAK